VRRFILCAVPSPLLLPLLTCVRPAARAIAQMQQVRGQERQAALEQLCDIVASRADAVRKAPCVLFCQQIAASL
jgi:hypothetical protein